MANNNRNGTYTQMQAVLQSQEAANEQVRQTMQAVENAMNMMSNTLATMQPPEYGPSHPRSGGVRGNAPRMPENQSRYRPGYQTDPLHGGSGPYYGRGVGGIRRSIAGTLDRRYGEGAGSSYSRVIDRTTGSHVGYIEHTSDGRTIQRGLGEVSQSDLAGAASRGAVSRGLGAFGEAGLMGAARAIPYVGAAVMGAEAIHEGVTLVSNQRAANAQYQSIYGGGNFEQFGQRAQGLGFQLGQLFGGGLTWGQSREAFQGVSALGYQGQQRGQDLNFITQNYMRMGVSVSDSLKLIQTAAGDLNESLTGLQDGLKNTRQAAIATGQSGNVGTQIFTNTYQSLSRNYAGPGVANLAATLAPINAGLGRYMQNVNFNGIFNDPAQVQIMASRMGMTYTQFVGQLQQGNLSKIMPALDFNVSRAIAPTMANPQVSNYVHQQVSSLNLGRNGRMSQDQLANVSQNLLSSDTGFNVRALKAALASANPEWANLTDQQATELAVGMQTGQVFNKGDIGKFGLKQTDLNSVIHQVTGHYGKGNLDTANPVIAEARKSKDLRGKYVQVKDASGRERVVSINEAIKDYGDQVAKGTAVVMGTGGQTVRQVLGGDYQKKFLTKDEIISKTNRVVSLNDEIEDDSYSGGSNATGKVKDKAGTSKDDLNKRKGMSVEAYNRMMASKEKTPGTEKVSGRVIVEPSPELKALLNFSTSGNVSIANSGASAGAVPAPGQ